MNYGGSVAQLAEQDLTICVPRVKSVHEGSPPMRKSQPPSCFSFVFTEKAHGEWRETYEAISECDYYEQSIGSNDKIPPGVGPGQLFSRKTTT